jgi:hypothetical protein
MECYRMSDENYEVYAIEYKFKDSTWDIELHATSREEAQARLRHISYGKVLGPIAMKIEVKPKLLQRLLLWLHRK